MFSMFCNLRGMGCKVAVARNGIYSGVNLFILSLFEAVVKTDC